MLQYRTNLRKVYNIALVKTTMKSNSTDILRQKTDMQKPPRDTSIAPYDPLQRYLMEVSHYKLLTKEEEYQLAVQYREKKDQYSAYKLVTGNLRLVVKIALEFHRAWVMSLLDLIQEGNIGLMQAVKKFDPHQGIRLSSYASFWIRAYILRFILDNWRLVKIGTTQAQRKLFFNLQKEKAKLEAIGYGVEPKQIAETIGVKEKEVIQMDQRMSSWEASLDAPLRDDAEKSLMDFLPLKQESIDNRLAEREIQSLVNDKLKEFQKTLINKERYLFERRLLTENPLTLQEIGDKYGITRERARQIEEKLLSKIKAYLEQEIPGIIDNQPKTGK